MYKNNNEHAITPNSLTSGPSCPEFPDQSYYKKKDLTQNIAYD